MRLLSTLYRLSPAENTLHCKNADVLAYPRLLWIENRKGRIEPIAGMEILFCDEGFSVLNATKVDGMHHGGKAGLSDWPVRVMV